MIDILWPTDHPSDYRWVPDTSTFGARLALVRQRMGWNLKEAALACQLPQGSWREWELKGRDAKNGFGGYNGNRRYTCDATVEGKTVSATVRTLDTEP